MIYLIISYHIALLFHNIRKIRILHYKLQYINNEAINPKVCDLTNKVADSKNNNETINPKAEDYPKIRDLIKPLPLQRSNICTKSCMLPSDFKNF